ncbi:MAG: hypothetical protein H0U92_06560 [Actinobacteria bacterium]|nr:hypothetical protein [Actinomycetota bacterium]
MPMREDCKHYATRTYGTGEMVRMCRLDLAPEAPWKCPDDCASYTRRTWDAGWTLGALADTQPDPEPPPADPKDAAALLDMAEDVINTIGADVLAEHRAEQETKSKGLIAKFKRKRGKR